jgi:hypothetical protein
MWRALLSAILLAGCAQLPPTPQDLQAKKFEAAPGKAAVYLVRDHPDFSDAAATVYLGDAVMVTTYAGTYYRWEAEPGTHRVTGFGADVGAIVLQLEAGRIYYLQQRVSMFFRFPQSYFQLVPEPQGRAAVMRAVLLGG